MMPQKTFEELTFTNRRGDHIYFTMIPNVLWFFDLTPADFKLYNTIVKTTGCDGQTQCFKSTKTLVKETGLSMGSISKAKARLEKAGLIERYSKKRTTGGRPIDHLVLVDIWKENMLFFSEVYSPNEETPTLSSLSELRQRVFSRNEGVYSPNETEEEPLIRTKKQQQEAKKKNKPVVKSSQSSPTKPVITPEEVARYQGRYQELKSMITDEHRQTSHLALIARNVDGKVALRLASKIEPARILQVCVAADLKESIDDRAAWIVAALNSGWNVRIPPDDTKPLSDEDRWLAAGQFRVKDSRTGEWKSPDEMTLTE